MRGPRLSAINSLTLSPALCVLLLKRKQKKQSRFSLFRPFNASLEWARKSYIKCAGIMVRRAWLTLILLAAVLVGNWKLFETVPKSFLPPEDKGTVFCDIQLAPGATLGRTEQAMRSAEQKLMSIPGRAPGFLHFRIQLHGRQRRKPGHVHRPA